jgi:hypothetical protein
MVAYQREDRGSKMAISVTMDGKHPADAERLIERLKALGCGLQVSGDRLVLTPGNDRIAPALLMELRRQKAEVMTLLKRRAPP